MSISLTNIRTLVRYILNDVSTSMSPGDIFTYDTSAVFTLSETNIDTVSTVLQNDTELASGDWSYDSDTNKVTVSASLSANDTIEIQYTYYPNYSDTEINSYVRNAVAQLGIHNYRIFLVGTDSNIYPEPTENEKNLIAIIASILIKPDNKSYSLPDIRVTVPRDSLPTRDIIRKTIAIFKNNTHGNFSVIG